MAPNTPVGNGPLASSAPPRPEIRYDVPTDGTIVIQFHVGYASHLVYTNCSAPRAYLMLVHWCVSHCAKGGGAVAWTLLLEGKVNSSIVLAMQVVVRGNFRSRAVME